MEQQKKFILSKQILRSGTSIGANVREAQSAESKADFKHKMYMAFKEARETHFWISLINDSPIYPTSETILAKSDEIIKILGKIISSCKSR